MTQEDLAWHLAEDAPDYRQLTATDAARTVKFLFDSWNAVILREEGSIPASFLADESDRSARWREASIRLGGRFLLALEWADEAIGPLKYRPWSPYLQSHFMDTSHQAGNVDSAVERRMLSEYLNARWNCIFMEQLGSASVGVVDESWDKFIYWGMQHIAEASAASGRREHLRLGARMIWYLCLQARRSSEIRDKKNVELLDIFMGSVVRTRDLRLLASRSKAMTERYGEKQVEVRLEQQLSLLFQSFGFYVVSTNRGERRVDLICLAPAHGTPAYSVLVEAKSSKSNYAFPTKDARAIEEYVARTAGLSTLPPLRLVLVVGPSPASTVGGKLKVLEASTSVPIRYCEAGLIGWLRDSISGPISFRSFLSSMVQSPNVITREALQAIRDGDKAQRKLHADFVAGLLELDH